MDAPILFVDFSADTSVRITLAAPRRRPPPAQLYHCTSLAQLDQTLEQFLDSVEKPRLMAAAFSVCGWERDGAFEMPDHSYRIEREWVKQRLNVTRLNVVNDCVATALAIERLEDSERTIICPGQDEPMQMKAMIAVGRSLGTTCILSDDVGSPLAVPCAGGHMDLPATHAREFKVIELMAKKYGHVSRVRAVSTAGLAEIHACLQTIDGAPAEALNARQVVDLARAGNPHAREAVDMAVGWLAATAADTALATGARGGIFLAGSFFDLLGDTFDRDLFTRRFCDKGRLSNYLRDISVSLVEMREPEMVGLSTLFG